MKRLLATSSVVAALSALVSPQTSEPEDQELGLNEEAWEDTVRGYIDVNIVCILASRSLYYLQRSHKYINDYCLG